MLAAPVWWMVGVSVGAWAAVAVMAERATALATLAGMLGPLAAACASWVVVSRVYRRDPARLTGVMGGAFFVKLVFFGAYVAVALRVAGFRPVPFVVSFTGAFIGLHGFEAASLRRLFLHG